jgi:hypothetical protein
MKEGWRFEERSLQFQWSEHVFERHHEGPQIFVHLFGSGFFLLHISLYSWSEVPRSRAAGHLIL